mmetsp:Transcript_22909/g.48285  ORF Transcript_22909/g.48285 Transcript_22909/m.48285 type:complete len:239 (+) Transcript_22909:832-1548(+)
MGCGWRDGVLWWMWRGGIPFRIGCQGSLAGDWAVRDSEEKTKMSSWRAATIPRNNPLPTPLWEEEVRVMAEWAWVPPGEDMAVETVVHPTGTAWEEEEETEEETEDAVDLPWEEEEAEEAGTTIDEDPLRAMAEGEGTAVDLPQDTETEAVDIGEVPRDTGIAIAVRPDSTEVVEAGGTAMVRRRWRGRGIVVEGRVTEGIGNGGGHAVVVLTIGGGEGIDGVGWDGMGWDEKAYPLI